MRNDTPKSVEWIELSMRILDSFEYHLRRPFMNRSGTPEQQADRLFSSSAVVVAHGTEDDPILCYANQAAIDLWETDLESLLAMPSRKTAEPIEQADRANMLRRGLEKGYIDDYKGVRITATGKRFHIENAVIWNLLDDLGTVVGQAASFHKWTFLRQTLRQTLD